MSKEERDKCVKEEIERTEAEHPELKECCDKFMEQILREILGGNRSSCAEEE